MVATIKPHDGNNNTYRFTIAKHDTRSTINQRHCLQVFFADILLINGRKSSGPV